MKTEVVVDTLDFLLEAIEQHKEAMEDFRDAVIPMLEEWHRPEVIPDSYVGEDGLRHAVVFGGDLLPERLSLEKSNNHWVVKKEPVF